MNDLSGETISSTQSMILDLPPSCIEFCPAHGSYFLVGTYNLQKSEGEENNDIDDTNESSEGKAKQSQSRNGSIIVFRLKDGIAYPIQTVPQPSAVFDLHFQPQDGRGDICAAVSSTGTISLFRLTTASAPPQNVAQPTAAAEEVLKPLATLRIPDLGDDVLFTFFAWHPTIVGLMAITTAAGNVILVQLHDDCRGLDVVEESIIEHSLEAWCVSFLQPTTHQQQQQQQLKSSSSSLFTVFSGGDDSALRYTSYDIPVARRSHSSGGGDDDNDDIDDSDTTSRIPYPPVTVPGHTAGVTFILPLSVRTTDGAHIILTGSYDDTIRVYSITPLHQTYGARRSKLLAEENLGGGVWRLTIISTTYDNNNSSNSIDSEGGGSGCWEVTVLASCMHAGTRVVRVRGGEDGSVSGIEVLARFEEHKSMNYGSDWSRVESSRLVGGGGGGGGDILCVSTSFYDRLLCVWKFSDGVGGISSPES